MTDLTDDLDRDEIDISLRPALVVGRRLVILATLCRRAFLESRQARGELDEDPEMERFDLWMWLQDHDLESDLTADEVRMFETEVGMLSSDEASAATWNSEALVALAWATESIPALPEPDLTSDPADVLAVIPAPWVDPNAWITSVILRDEAEIAQERERDEVWLWRAEVEEERRQLKGRARQALEAEIADVVKESVAAGLLGRDTRGDFRVADRQFPELPFDQVDAVGAIAAVRLHALNWLCGFGSTWDDVPLEVD
jgi:hypothetical protein